VFFDVSIGGVAAGRVTIGLYGSDVPKVDCDARVANMCCVDFALIVMPVMCRLTRFDFCRRPRTSARFAPERRALGEGRSSM
jgi:hypothetical protein